MTGREIAEVLGCTRNAVIGFCWRNAITLPGPHEGTGRPHSYDHDRAMSQYLRGLSAAEVASNFLVHPSQIHTERRRRGIPSHTEAMRQ